MDSHTLTEFLVVLGVIGGLVGSVNLLHFLRDRTGLRFKLTVTSSPLTITVTVAGWLIGKYGLAPWVILVASVLGLFASAFKDWAAKRWVIRPIQQLKDCSQAIASGDLSASVHLPQRDEMGEMADAFRRMTATLQGILTEVRSSADSVAAAAEQTNSRIQQTTEAMGHLGSQTQQVAKSAEVLSHDVEETSALMETIVSSILGVAQSADETTEVKALASDAAETGTQAVTKTVRAMEVIEHAMREIVSVIEGLGRSSSEIGTIMGLIDGIAKKTNLLALNAAIEAARAGEHGKGFAVVADEVRRLAEHSAKATGDSAQILQDIQQQIDQALRLTREGNESIQGGRLLAQSTGVALFDVVTAMTRVADRLEEIREATREQANGGEAIVRAVESMTQLTHQVSSATLGQQRESERVHEALEDIHRMAASLHEEAEGLREAIAYFKQAELSRVIPANPTLSLKD